MTDPADARGPAGRDSGLLHTELTEPGRHRPLLEGQDVMDALDAPTCVVDAQGLVVAVNASWIAFGEDNDGEGVGLGADYLATCDAAASSESSTPVSGAAAGVGAAVDAREVAAGLRSVIAGESELHVHEYACHSPTRQRWFAVRIRAVVTRAGRSALLSHVDVTADRQTRNTLMHQALHDQLTGLPNRVLLFDRFAQAQSSSARSGTHVGVAFLDLDNFKRVNDTFGHPTGDALLVAVADRLGGVLRDADTLARYSGDEFVAMWRDLATPAEATELGDRLRRSLEHPFEVDGHQLEVGASVGVAVAQHGQGMDDVLMAADAAMFDAKRHGRGRTRTFRSELRDGVQSRVAVEVGLRAALARHELVLHYQPVIDLSSGRPVAVEALVRWQDPQQGLLGPGEFISVAESSGLILQLGRWALMQACRDIADLRGNAAGLDVAINLSAHQLTQPHLLQHVREALSTSGLAPGRLILEVTESAVVEDEQAAALALEELDGLGVRLAIDDFGTGWSSLLYLRQYPISTLKIDRAFVSGIGRSHDDEAICASVASLAAAVGATCVAEGVETAEQHEALQVYGCHQAQGFLWSPAVPLEELDRALARSSATSAGLSPGPRQRRRSTVLPPLDKAVAGRISTLHGSGASLHTIAAALNSELARNPTGLRWTAAAVARHIAA